MSPPRPTTDLPDHIDIDNADSLAEWAKKLDASPEQLKEAAAAVGTLAADIEMHLKGTHSTTNADRVEESGGS